MDYSIISKIQKAKEYAEDPSRVTFNSLEIEFRGNNNTYRVTLGPDGWQCTCPGFQTYGICPHIMTLEKLFTPMLKRERLPYAPGQNIVSDVEKANQYAHETDRIRFISFEATFRGGHNTYHVTYHDGKWNCDNPYFQSRGVCSNTMAMEKLLKGMVKPVFLVQESQQSVE
ncbi:MAG: SWIM zinc finger family protein [Chloroflexi bacterium]|nr:MAG: SWIM zinc finger family protein [Chloroflexota bacterium]